MVASPSASARPGGGSTSTSWQLTPTPILTVADLAALPRDRIIVMPSGAPPVLAQPVYWWNTKRAPADPGVDRRLRPRRRLARRHAPQAGFGTRGRPEPERTTARSPPLAGAGAAGRADRPQRARAALASMARKAPDRRAADCSTPSRSSELALQARRAAARRPRRPARPYYLTLAEWVEQWLFPVYRRSVLGHERVWCPQWWRHAEAVARLEALWRAWEHLRQDAATGLSVWFRDHADHHMTSSWTQTGRSKAATATHSERPVDELPSRPAPRGHVRTRRRPHTHDARRHPSCLPRRLYRRCRTQLDDPASSMNHPLPHGFGTA